MTDSSPLHGQLSLDDVVVVDDDCQGDIVEFGDPNHDERNWGRPMAEVDVDHGGES